MKKLFCLFCVQTVAAFGCNLSASAQTGLNIHIGADGIDIRPDAFTSYYQAPPERVAWLRQQKIPEEQWPLLFEIARAGNVTPDRVWETRRQQSTWYDVLNALNVPPAHFYYDAPSDQRLAPPYGRAYGYYRNHPTETMRWSDVDLVKLASVKYISDSTHRPAHESVMIYQKHPHFIHAQDVAVAKNKHGHGKGIGHGHNKQKKGHGHKGKHGNHKK